MEIILTITSIMEATQIKDTTIKEVMEVTRDQAMEVTSATVKELTTTNSMVTIMVRLVLILTGVATVSKGQLVVSTMKVQTMKVRRLSKTMATRKIVLEDTTVTKDALTMVHNKTVTLLLQEHLQLPEIDNNRTILLQIALKYW